MSVFFLSSDRPSSRGDGTWRPQRAERPCLPWRVRQTASCRLSRMSRVKASSVHADAFSRAPWTSYPPNRRKRLRTAYFGCAVFRAKSVASRRPSRARFFIITLLPLTASRWSWICWRKLITYSIYRCHTLSKPKARAYAAADVLFRAADAFSCVPWVSYPTKPRKSLRTRVCEGVGEGKKKKPPQWGGFGLGVFWLMGSGGCRPSLSVFFVYPIHSPKFQFRVEVVFRVVHAKSVVGICNECIQVFNTFLKTFNFLSNCICCHSVVCFCDC